MRHSSTSSDPRPFWLGPWLVLLIQEAPKSTGELLDYALVNSQLPTDAQVALLLFDHLTEPRSDLRDSLGLGGSPRLELRLRGEWYWLDAAWKKVFYPNLPEVASDVLAILDRHLRRAHTLLTAAGPTALAWDRLNSRSAIEPHGQDGHKAMPRS